MQKATCSEVALWGVSEYPDHSVGADALSVIANDPGLGRQLRSTRVLGDRQACYWWSRKVTCTPSWSP